jgi:6-pyruvoyltetrahydropterin/6-carboxytetrahydropterin synthase
MPKVLLTKRIEFSASHRYHNNAWDGVRNRAVFGACNNPSGHGHNYLLEVTVGGEVGDESGMVVNLYDLKVVLKEALGEFDHKHLNLDTPYFQHRIPTTENIAGVLWRLLASRPEIGELERIRLFEDEDLYAEITKGSLGGAEQVTTASLTRRYHFSASHRAYSQHLSKPDNERVFGRCSSSAVHGHNYVLEVTVGGPIDAETGMVTDIPALDRAVEDRVLSRFNYRHLNDDPDLFVGPLTGERIARLLWALLVKSISGGRLARIRLVETADTAYEYVGL